VQLLHAQSTDDGASADEFLGAPWSRPLAGSFDRLVVESELLAGNPLGDPARRPLYVLRPPGVELDHPRPLPVIYVIQGFTGQLDMWTNRTFMEPNFIERADAMLASEGCPDAIVVMVDCWTSYGGSQFLDSAGTGNYQSYLCDEIVQFIDERYPTAADRDHRGLTGKSSGGYGAMVVPMMRPDVFSALASHAGDALFEMSMVRGFAGAARTLRDHFEGSYDVFFARLREADPVDFGLYADPLEMYGYAACYTPDPDRPGKALVPFEIETGKLIPELWERWLDHDPVRMAPRHADALRSMRRIYLDAGRSDEYHLDLGAQAFSAELDKLGVEHTLDLFEGKHGGIAYRYPGAIRELAVALST
jgi:S-formylglutathione hydrolase FrmB